MLFSLLSPAFPEEQVPTFTNEDLRKYLTEPLNERESPQQNANEEAPSPPDQKDAAAIIRENRQSIVVIGVLDKNGAIYGHGSGFVVSRDGVVVTSYHVIRNAAEIRIKAGDEVYPVAGIIHADVDHDIAILKAEGSGLHPVRIGNSGNVFPGEKVYVIANPRGTGLALLEGILAEIREVAGKGRMLQITAPFTEGYSGSPVLNERGEVIGMATFIVKGLKEPSGYQKLNFAVPVDRIRDSVSSSSLTPSKDLHTNDYRETSGYWVGLGNTLTGSEKYTEAADAYKKALGIDPADVEALNGLGISYMKLKKYKEAIETFKHALALGSESAWLYSNLGLAYIEARMYKEALGPLKQAVNTMPELEEAHYNLGIAYKNLGMSKEAIASFKNALSINPGSRDAHFGLGLTYMDVKDKDAALEEYSLLKTLDSSLAGMLLKRIRQ